MRPAFAHFTFPPALEQSPHGDWPLGATAQHAVLRHVRRLLSLRAPAWDGETEALRRLRVAARRARTSLGDFASLWDTATVRGARRALARLADRVGNGRDLEVALATFAEVPVEPGDASAVSAAVELLAQRRDAWRTRARAALATFETSGWPARLLGYFASHPFDLWTFVDRDTLLHGEGPPHR